MEKDRVQGAKGSRVRVNYERRERRKVGEKGKEEWGQGVNESIQQTLLPLAWLVSEYVKAWI